MSCRRPYRASNLAQILLIAHHNPRESEAAFETLASQYDHLLRLTVRIAERYGVSPDEAEDISQEVFLRLLEVEERGRCPDDIAYADAYIQGVIKNVIDYNGRRRAAQRSAYKEDLERAIEGHLSGRVDGHRCVEARYDALTYLAQAPARTRELAARVFVLGEHQKDAAAAVGVSPATATRALKTFTADLKKR